MIWKGHNLAPIKGHISKPIHINPPLGFRISNPKRLFTRYFTPSTHQIKKAAAFEYALIKVDADQTGFWMDHSFRMAK